MENLTSSPADAGQSPINLYALQQSLAENAGLQAALQAAHAQLFAPIAVLVTAAQVRQMRAVIAAIERIVALPGWQQEHAGESPYIPKNPGVFFGYDFHLNADGAHLIEINTNAGGAFLNAVLLRSQRNVALPGKALAQADLEQDIVAMFRREWQLQRADAPLRCIAIVDEAPQSQYLYPEFILAQQLFERAGITAVVADPAALQARADGLYCGEIRVDMVYNRLTDFSLQAYPHLLTACQQNQLVLTPHPRAYRLYADKRNLASLTNAEYLHGLGGDVATIATLQQGIPQTRLIASQDAELWWQQRKQWFFKPATGFGSKGSYRGDKVTKRVFEEIMQGDYVAQKLAAPGERSVQLADAAAAALKFDVRCYVYQGEVQLVAARLYQGQTTNFRTPGGGFAVVREA